MLLEDDSRLSLSSSIKSGDWRSKKKKSGDWGSEDPPSRWTPSLQQQHQSAASGTCRRRRRQEAASASVRGAASAGEGGLRPERRQVPLPPQGQGIRRRLPPLLPAEQGPHQRRDRRSLLTSTRSAVRPEPISSSCAFTTVCTTTVSAATSGSRAHRRCSAASQVHLVPRYRRCWAPGLLLGFGASAAVLIKKLFIPRPECWIHKAKVLKSLNGRDSLSVTREDRFLHYRPLEEHALSAARNGPVNTPWRPPQPNMYAVPNSDFGSGRPSFAPAPTEPASGSFSRSYVEQTVQRGDRSPGSKQPWEMQQYVQPKLGYESNTHLSEDGLYSEAQESYGPSYHQNRKAPDFHAEEPRPLSYSTRVEERLRQPKSLAKQPLSDASEAAGEMQVNGAQSSSYVTAEVPVNGGALSDAGHGNMEEQVEAI